MPIPAAARRRAGVISGPQYQDFTLATYTIDNNGACNERLDCDIYIFNDGTVDRRRENYGSSTQIQIDKFVDVATAGFGDDYHAKLTPVSGSSFFDPTNSDTLSTWHALTSDRVWHFDEQDCEQQVTQDYTLAISDDGGSTTLDSMVITCSWDFDTP